MRVKQVLKRTLTAGMLALMACTSMSAMAESTSSQQWMWVSDVCDYSSDDCRYKGFDAICEYYANSRSSSAWPVIYLGGWTITGPNSLRCNADNKLDQQDFVSASFKCPNGSSFDMERPNGCYEFKDIIVNGELCTDYPDKPNQIGGVGCNNKTGEKQICTWLDKMGNKDPDAKDIIRTCNITHEIAHANDQQLECLDGAIGTHGVENGPEHVRMESIGYNAEADCIRRERENCNNAKNPAACDADVKTHYEYVDRMGRLYQIQHTINQMSK